LFSFGLASSVPTNLNFLVALFSKYLIVTTLPISIVSLSLFLIILAYFNILFISLIRASIFDCSVLAAS